MSRSAKATTSVSSFCTSDETYAMALDPAALWAALDLSAPESTPSQHTSRRLVLLGRPLSGKRTLCRRLCFAAEMQYAGSDDADVADPEQGSFSKENDQQPLYCPSSDDGEDPHILPSQRVAGWNMPGGFSSGGASAQTAAVGARDHSNLLSHGSGVSFDYVVQRVPIRAARRGGEMGVDSTSTHQHASTGLLPAFLGGTVRRTTEFFICDSPGALAMALPTLDHIESAVVLMVIDVSDVSNIHYQLDYCFSTLDGYVTSLLRTQAPNHDAVRRMQLAAAQQDYWISEEQKLQYTRTSLASSSDGPAAAAANASTFPPLSSDTFSNVHFSGSMAHTDRVSSTIFPLPASAEILCPMRCMIICTKVDCLERSSRALGLPGSSTFENEALVDRLGVPAELRLAMRHSQESLISLVSQLVRQYAIHHRVALASVCWRVSMTTAGVEGGYANSSVISPFFKGLWSYISYVLYNSREDNTSVPSDALHVCSARLYPHALLPFGLDALGLLNNLVTSNSFQLPEGASLAPSEGPSDAAVRTTADSVITPDRVFPLHQMYLQQAQEEQRSAALVWCNTEEAPQRTEAMVWDSL